MSLLNCLRIGPHSSYSPLEEGNPVADPKAETQLSGEDSSSNKFKFQELEISRLLLLPKELRLEIWKHALTDPSKERLVLCIKRRLSHLSTSGKRFSNSLYKHVDLPEIQTTFIEPPVSTLSVNILQTNRFIYNEALPILYHSVSFFICDTSGIFQLFLDQLSGFARSHIRYVRLEIHGRWQCTQSLFYWALSCAQVAKLSSQLRQVEVKDWLAPADIKTAHRDLKILYSLLKIKAPKKFIGGCGTEAAFQRDLKIAEANLETVKDARRTRTAADFINARSRADMAQLKGEQQQNKRQKINELACRVRSEVQFCSIDDREVEDDLVNISGIRRFEEELTSWEMVGTSSTSSSSRVRTASICEEASWVDTASTIVAKAEDDNGKNKEVDTWEIVEK